MSDVPQPGAASPAPSTPHAWQAISARDRRVLGVLVEKAKTTPDVYPMSINAIRTGANQKNNRHPLLELENDDVEQSLERLRGLKAVSEVQGDSRVPRYRHLLYDWLGVDKLELAVMAELLLRGAQTEGDLRAHAARMEPIPDLETLRTVVAALKTKGLVIGLTPAGRGHVVTHALYQEQELEKLRAEYRGRGDEAAAAEHHAPPPSTDRPRRHLPSARVPAANQPEFPRQPAASCRPRWRRCGRKSPRCVTIWVEPARSSIACAAKSTIWWRSCAKSCFKTGWEKGTVPICSADCANSGQSPPVLKQPPGPSRPPIAISCPW